METPCEAENGVSFLGLERKLLKNIKNVAVAILGAWICLLGLRRILWVLEKWLKNGRGVFVILAFFLKSCGLEFCGFWR
jgi:hypothetical protein